MKNSKLNYNIISMACFILLIINYKFLYLIPMGSFGSRSNQLIYVPATLLLIVCIFLYNVQTFNFFYSKFLILFFGILLLELFFSLFKYPTEPILKQIIPYFSVLSYYIYSCYAQLNLKRFLKMLIIFSTIASIICNVEAISNSLFGKSFFYIYGYNYGVTTEFFNSINSLRNGRFRVIGSDLIDFTSVISIGCLYTPKVKISRKLLWLNIISVAFYEIFSSQVRSMCIYVLATFIILYLIKGKSRILKTLFGGSGIIGVIFVIFNVVKNISIDYSYSNRISEFSFYVQRFLKSPIFGNGLLPEKPVIMEDYTLVHGPDILGGYAYSDIGMFGLMGKIGIFGLILYIILLMMFLKCYKKNKNSLCLAIFIIVSFSTINLSLFDGERLVVLAIFMAVCDGVEFGGK